MKDFLVFTFILILGYGGLMAFNSGKLEFGTTAPPEEAKSTILRTTRTIHAGEVISSDALRLEQVTTSRKPPDAVTTKVLVKHPKGGWRAMFSIPEGTVLCYQALGPGKWTQTRNHQWAWRRNSSQM